MANELQDYEDRLDAMDCELEQANPIQVRAPVAPIEKKKRAAVAPLRPDDYALQLAYLQLLTTGNGPVTDLAPPVTGATLDGSYREVYVNNGTRPVRVQAFVTLVTPGCGVKLSKLDDLSDGAMIDALALVANGKTDSVPMVLLPGERLMARNWDYTNFPMGTSDVLRVRIFDPNKLLMLGRLYNF